jgi:L-serine dehydratase
LNKQAPSIFNDVIGPIMRGPSSSHTAAAVRIGRLLRQFHAGKVKHYIVEFTPSGSLATTYNTQGSDFGLVGGLLGMDTADPGLTAALTAALEIGLKVEFIIKEYEASHPNTYRIRARSEIETEDLFTFISTGGGMIELREINGFSTAINGDYYETLLFFKNIEAKAAEILAEDLKRQLESPEFVLDHYVGNDLLIEIKSRTALSAAEQEMILARPGLKKMVLLDPVLPVLSNRVSRVPFLTAKEILENQQLKLKSTAALAINYEMARGGMTEEAVLEQARNLVRVMRDAVGEGLAGTKYEDRILGPQAGKMLNYSGRLVGGQLNKRVVAYISALMETKSAMGVIVAAPTAGSCAGLPGTLLAVANENNNTEEEVVKALLAAGLIGVFIAAGSTFAAEECSCQAECGSGSGMAAAALVQLAGGTVTQAFSAASMALQNLLGLACDPVATRVEVPCLGKNIVAGMNALAAADMALAGYDPVIPLDQTITAQDQVGRLMPPELCCTGKAGLSVTPASLALFEKMQRN